MWWKGWNVRVLQAKYLSIFTTLKRLSYVENISINNCIPFENIWRRPAWFACITGRMFGVGEQPFLGSTLSSAFPLVNHPAFGALYSAGAGRPEFGGLGSLGMSAALAAHPQLGALSGNKGTFTFVGQRLAKCDCLFNSLLSSFFYRLVASCWSAWTGSRCLSPLFHRLPSFLQPSHSAQPHRQSCSDQDAH